MDRYDSQFVNGGIEFSPARSSPVGVSFRFGAYKNVAEPTENVVYSLGLGLRLGPVKVDLAVSGTFAQTNVETDPGVFDQTESQSVPDFSDLYPERFGASAVVQITYPF